MKLGKILKKFNYMGIFRRFFRNDGCILCGIACTEQCTAVRMSYLAQEVYLYLSVKEWLRWRI